MAAERKKKEKYVTYPCEGILPGWTVFKKNRDNVVNRIKGILSEFYNHGYQREGLTRLPNKVSRKKKARPSSRASGPAEIRRIHSSSWRPGTVDDVVGSLKRAAPFGAILCRFACILSMQRMQSVVTEGVVC